MTTSDWIAGVAAVFAFGSAWGAIAAARIAYRAQFDDREARKRDNEREALALFVGICTFFRRASAKGTEHADEAARRAGEIYAHLAANGGDKRRAQYVASTGCAWANKHDTSNLNEQQRYLEARDSVEEHLRFPERALAIPKDDIVHLWSRSVAANMARAPWLLP